MDPSRLKREDTEQLKQIRELKKQRREIDDQINEIRNQDTRINPYNVNRHVEETVQSIIADLRNMEQAPWSGNLDGWYDYSPLHRLFNTQFGVSDENEDNWNNYPNYSPLHTKFRDQFSISEEEDNELLPDD
jgi:hypothetical protein